jgi:hypothetical protein
MRSLSYAHIIGPEVVLFQGPVKDPGMEPFRDQKHSRPGQFGGGSQFLQRLAEFSSNAAVGHPNDSAAQAGGLVGIS